MPQEMIEFRRNFGPIRFPRATIKSFLEKAASILPDATAEPGYRRLVVWRGSQQWGMPTVSDFLAEVDIGYDSFSAYLDWGVGGSVRLDFEEHFTLSFTAPTRDMISTLVEFIESMLDTGKRQTKATPPIRVFIGHGRSQEWQKLKNHLADLHHLQVEAYEVASRSGYSIREVLDTMLKNSSIAFLVMTAEDLQDDGTSRARQNVVHEAGLFQGRLGFPRAVILREEGVESLSNLDGIQYIAFAQGNIREAFGEVLAVIRREFPDALARA